MKNEEFELQLSDFRKKLSFWIFLRNFLFSITLWGFSCGILVYVLKFLRIFDNSSALNFYLFSTICLLVPSIIASNYYSPDKRKILEYLDSINQSGGILMSESEEGSEEWRSRLNKMIFPEISISMSLKKSSILALSITFGFLAAYIPVFSHSEISDKKISIVGEIDQMKNRIESLQEAEIIKPSQSEKLLERLDELKSKEKGTDIPDILEALDNLQQSLSKLADEGIKSKMADLKRDLNTQSALESAMKNKDSKQFTLPPDFPSLEKMMENASGTIKPGIPGKGIEGLSRSDIASLAEKLDSEMEKQLRQLMKLTKSGFLDSEALEKLQKMKLQKIDLKDLIKALSESKSGCNSKNASEAVLISVPVSGGDKDNKPGSGGLGRGRGDAELHLGESVKDEGKKFTNQVVPPSYFDPGKAELVGYAISAPTKNTEVVPAEKGNLNTQSKDGGTAVNRDILPRHRRAVKEYFRRE
ncbi:MAG: hypothetical protein HQM10_07155 [Candidatus Riflebacteria bacterium]|nr:hypothetical protein [Candidatus Riflebacteria bacterium]